MNGNDVHAHEPWVHFEVGDVYFPDPVELLRELHAKDLLQGRVVDVSDGTGSHGAFLVVQVDGLAQPVVVPANRVKGVL